ncbi:MAG: hypothetical protein GQF41_2379 [Candidatus Rifleibacterium amylolyticum]|nr:MAG: hypothetical protein GQF41_2379 [Candidatus Rifleibacterium amylolyticum]
MLVAGGICVSPARFAVAADSDYQLVELKYFRALKNILFYLLRRRCG